MAELAIDMIYSSALYEAAKDENKVDTILNDIKDLQTIFEANSDFVEFMNTPVIAKEERKQIVKEILENKINTETLNFLLILIDKRMVKHFNNILKHYQYFINEEKNITSGIIFSVEHLSNDQIKQFEDKTGALLKKKIKLTNQIDSSILGGVKIFTEGKVIDASIKKQLSDLRHNMSIE
jgi:ATP synthase F1 delta subunit